MCTKHATKKVMLGKWYHEDGDCWCAFQGCPTCYPDLMEVVPYYGGWKIKR